MESSEASQYSYVPGNEQLEHMMKASTTEQQR